MRMRHFTKPAVIAALTAALFAMAGCASPGKDIYLHGMSLEQQKRLDAAASLYQVALAQDPRNREYAEALGRVRAGLATQYLASARNFLATKPFTYAAGRSARSDVDKALKLSPGDAKVAAVSREVSAMLEQLTREADALYVGAEKAASANEWVSALEKLEQIRDLYPSYPGLPDKISSVEMSGTSWYLSEAEKERGEENLEAAQQLLEKAAQLQPGNGQIAELIDDLSRQNSTAGYLSRSTDALKGGKLAQGVALARKGMLAKDAGAKAALAKVVVDAALLTFDAANSALKDKKLYECYTNLLQCKSFSGSAVEPEKISELVDRLASAIREKAAAYEAAENLGNALVWYEKAHALQPSDAEAPARIAALRDRIRQRVVKKIAVMEFVPPSNNSDAGRIVTDTLLSNMTRSVSGEIKILARDVLGALLKEIELGQAGLYDIEGAKKAGKLKGTDVFIFGNVLSYDIEKEKEEGVKRVNAVVGKRSISNPVYEQWSRRHPNPVGKELKSAPPQLIEEPVHEVISYKVATHRKIANVSVSFRVIDVENGEVVITKTLKRCKEAVDTYQEGVEFADIPFKELKLPSDSELLGQVVDGITEELSQEVLNRFQNLQLSYYSAAEQEKKKSAVEGAIEKYVDAILVEEVKNVSSQVTEDSRREIEQLLGAPPS
jgi:tetratricopeptide (TPR) repeat protein